MFIRRKFVTNSSTTSYLVYGIWLNSDNLEKVKEKMINPALLANADKILAKAKEWEMDTDDFESAPTDMDRIECLNEMINEIGAEEFNNLLPAPLVLYQDQDEWQGYLYIDLPLKTEVKDGQVILKNFTSAEIEILKKFCEDAGIKYVEPQLHDWARADY